MLIKFMFRKLQRALLLALSSGSGRCNGSKEVEAATLVPDDVPKGHFVVVASEGEEVKRFVVELGYLTEPTFLTLLDKAREEYGFGQKGALSIPCRPQDLQMILKRKEGDGGEEVHALCMLAYSFNG